MYTHAVILVADGARADLMQQLLNQGRLPNMQRHLVDRGCYKTALTVFPSTTGPAHIPFVCGVHPGTANVPGYRWLDRAKHDLHRRSIYRHRSLNSPRGLLVGRDMDPKSVTSLFEYFDQPASVLELVDFAPGKSLSKVVVRRLLRIVQAHRSDDWSHVDDMVERLVIGRLRSGSQCVIGSFFGIDEYSHLYDPFDDRTVGAYLNIDRAVGEIVGTLADLGIYERTVIAIVSDHGLSATHTHIPVVDIVKQHGFDPYYYPKMYRRRRDSAVMESGNSMAAIYFKRGDEWGPHWRWEEMQQDGRISRLTQTLINTQGVSFVAARSSGGSGEEDGIVIAGSEGLLRATRSGSGSDTVCRVETERVCPLGGHPVGEFAAHDLTERTYNDTFPDAVNQVFLLFDSPRSGDLAISSEPGFDLRWQHEDPEHHGSHGSLHREHMHVPLLTNLPIATDYVANYDLVPTILQVCGKKPRLPLDGRVLPLEGAMRAVGADRRHDANPQSELTGNPGGEHHAALELDDLEEAADQLVDAAETEGKKAGYVPLAITLGIIALGIVMSTVFKEDVMGFGEYLMTNFGRDKVDVILFFITAISSSPLAMPIWAYVLVGVALGMSVVRLAAVTALGSATGSLITFLLGRYFGNSEWVKRRFPKVHRHPWTTGKSRAYVTMLLFLGTASPIPCDVFYVACGVKRYPPLLFWVTMVMARFVRYIYMGYGFKYGSELFDWIV